MTIITAHKSEKKAFVEEKTPKPAEDFLVTKAPYKDEEVPLSLVVESQPRLRRSLLSICMPLIGILLILIMLVGGLYVYKLLAHRTVTGYCKVPYYYEELTDDYQMADLEVIHGYERGHYGGTKTTRHTGVFEEMLELDIIENNYEKFDVPAFEDVMGASVVHDFQKNLSAIVDATNYDCFIMELNRTIVQPPKDLWDLLNKLGEGYYLPNTEMIRKRYEVMGPPVRDVSQLGFHIWEACRRYDTYLLRELPDNEPVAMVKRDVSMQDRTYAIAPAKIIQKVMIHMRAM